MLSPREGGNEDDRGNEDEDEDDRENEDDREGEDDRENEDWSSSNPAPCKVRSRTRDFAA